MGTIDYCRFNQQEHVLVVWDIDLTNNYFGGFTWIYHDLPTTQWANMFPRPFIKTWHLSIREASTNWGTIISHRGSHPIWRFGSAEDGFFSTLMRMIGMAKMTLSKYIVLLLRKIGSNCQKSAHCKGDVTMWKSFIEVSEGSPQKKKEHFVEKLRVTESELQHYQ